MADMLHRLRSMGFVDSLRDMCLEAAEINKLHEEFQEHNQSREQCLELIRQSRTRKEQSDEAG